MIVVMLGCDELPHLDLNPELFLKLPFQALLRRFTILNLTPRKLPIARKLLISRPPGDEDFPFLFNYGTGDGGHIVNSVKGEIVSRSLVRRLELTPRVVQNISFTLNQAIFLPGF